MKIPEINVAVNKVIMLHGVFEEEIVIFLSPIDYKDLMDDIVSMKRYENRIAQNKYGEDIMLYLQSGQYRVKQREKTFIGLEKEYTFHQEMEGIINS